MTRAERPQATSSSSPTAITATSQCLLLAGKTCDLVMELTDAFNAYLALECFVTPEYADEAQARVPPPRAQLTALLRAVNVDIQRRLGVLADTTTVLQAQLTLDAAQPR